MEKIKPRMEYGIFAGVSRKSGEFLVSDKNGIRKVRTIRRIDVSKRWSMDNLSLVVWAPWRRGMLKIQIEMCHKELKMKTGERRRVANRHRRGHQEIE
eukprot:11762412-Karenia_brevis.AAC.1